MIVTETIHYGGYRSTRTTEVEPTVESLAAYLAASEFPYTPTNHERVGTLLAELVESGETDLGWSHFQVVSG